LDEIVEIYRKVKKRCDEVRRIKAAWREHLKKALEMEDILKCIDQNNEFIEFEFKNPRKGRCAHLKNRIEKLPYFKKYFFFFF
jgi:hypothetical protein